MLDLILFTLLFIQQAPDGDTAHIGGGMETALDAYGHVLDGEERPITEARVLIIPDPHQETVRTDQPPPAVLPTFTGRDGRFDVRGLAPGIYTLDAQAAGFRRFTVPGIEVGEETAGSVDLGSLVLIPDRPLQGRVSDVAGRPIEEARIVFELENPALDPDPSPPGDRERFTRADGTFTLESLPADAHLRLEISHDSFRTRHLSGVPAERRQPLSIVLERGLLLAGDVIDARGNPASDATVELVRDVELRSLVTSASTDAQGRFHFPNQAPGRVTLQVRSPAGFARPTELDLVAGETPRDVRLELMSGASVAGWVLDPDRTGIAHAAIRIVSHQPGVVDEPREPWTPEERSSGEDGRFLVTGLPAGSYRLSAHHPDFRPVIDVVELGADSASEVELVFREHQDQEGPRVTGRVLDPDGRGIDGVRVGLNKVEGQPAAASTSEPGGLFEITAPGGGDYVVEVQHPGFAAYRSEPLRLAGASPEPLTVQLTVAGSITGSITGLESESLATLRIAATSQQGIIRDGQVRYDGTYRIPGLGPDRWSVRAQTAMRNVSKVFRLAAEGAEVRIDLHFESGFGLTGTALRFGEPAARASIRILCPEQGFQGSTSTDGSGRFEFHDVPVGACTLALIGALGTIEARQQVEVRGETEVILELESIDVFGRVSSADGKRPIAGAKVDLTDASSPWPVATALTDSQGRFALRALDRNRWKIRIAKQGFAVLEWDIVADGAEELLFHLHPSEPTELYVLGPKGDVPAYVKLEVHNGAGSTILSQIYQPELDGKITLRSLPTGFWQLLVSTPGSSTRTRLRVPGEPVHLVLGGGS